MCYLHITESINPDKELMTGFVALLFQKRASLKPI